MEILANIKLLSALNPKPEKPKPADTRTEPDPLPSLLAVACFNSH